MTVIYGDAHVHIYQNFDLRQLFRAALARAQEVCAPLLLLLSENAGDDYFRCLRRLAEAGVLTENATLVPQNLRKDLLRSVRLHRTAESLSLALADRGASAGSVFLIAGRQLISEEGIEVLALCLDPDDPVSANSNGSLSAASLAQQVLDAGAAAVLPWGLGKWVGARGTSVAALASNPALQENSLFLLGDTAHRCWPWPTPRVFRGAVRVLPGSDILPVHGAEHRLARYGFRVAGVFDPERPAFSLLEILRSGQPIETMGRRESLLSALKEQIRYRLRKSRSGIGETDP